jgi:hypothetical protein
MLDAKWEGDLLSCGNFPKVGSDLTSNLRLIKA